MNANTDFLILEANALKGADLTNNGMDLNVSVSRIPSRRLGLAGHVEKIFTLTQNEQLASAVIQNSCSI